MGRLVGVLLLRDLVVSAGSAERNGEISTNGQYSILPMTTLVFVSLNESQFGILHLFDGLGIGNIARSDSVGLFPAMDSISMP